jgi:hypothetical protein
MNVAINDEKKTELFLSLSLYEPVWNNTLIEENGLYFNFSYNSFDSSKISFGK